MSIATIKLDLAKKIIATDNHDIINHIKALFDTSAQENWFENLPENIKISVEKGIKEADNGEGIPHTEAMEKVRKWLKK